MPETNKTAWFEFDTELISLLPHRLRDGGFNYTFNGPQSAKHLVEALGIPHTEVGSMTLNGQPGALDHMVQEGDRIQVKSPTPGEFDFSGNTAIPRFVLDAHLGRLAAYLRMLGVDCLYRNDFTDPELVHISVDESRILLTRDRRLLMHKAIRQGCLVRSLDPTEQFSQIIQRYALKSRARLFNRCLLCNHELRAVSKTEVVDRLEPLTRMYFDEFHICPQCRQIYWKGSHYSRMLQLIERAGIPSNADQEKQPPAR